MRSSCQIARGCIPLLAVLVFPDQASAVPHSESDLRMGPEIAVAEQGDAPDVAVDGRGNFAVVYRIRGPWVQQVEADGTLLGDPIFLGNDPLRFSPRVRVAANERGDFVATWAESVPDGGSSFVRRIYARPFDRFGPTSDPIAVSPDDATEFAQDSEVAINTRGRFVVTWTIGLTGFGYRVFAPDGSPLSPALELRDVCGLRCYGAPVAMRSNGSFVIAWTVTTAPFQYELHARSFAPDGSPLGPGSRVDGFPASAGIDSLAVDRGNSYRIFFFGLDGPGQTAGWYFRKLRGNGSPLGTPRRVFAPNAASPDFPNSLVPAFALDASGRALVTWTHYGATKEDPHGYGIRGAAWSADSTQITPDRGINQQFELWQTYSEAACNASGRCVVVWPWEYDDDGGTRVRARQVTLPKR